HRGHVRTQVRHGQENAELTWAEIYLQENGETKPLTLDGFNASPRTSHDGRVLSWWALETTFPAGLSKFYSQ
ncbi:MAG TPA: hypothetical protein VGO93_11165, partial [Candidatus Xenobia bacterium]